MALFNLESLVQRGVTVHNDGQAVDPRRGTSDWATTRTPEIVISMRHLLPGCPRAFLTPAGRLDHAAKERVDEAVFGAGRSQSLGGVLSRRSPVLVTGGTIPNGRSPAIGGSKPKAVTCLAVTALGRENSGRLPAASQPSSGEGYQGLAARLAWYPRASRTSPASTRGKGGR